jgi:hypothetical protein
VGSQLTYLTHRRITLPDSEYTASPTSLFIAYLTTLSVAHNIGRRIVATYDQWMPITVAARSKAWTVFGHSNHTPGMDVCVSYPVRVVLYVASGIATGWSPIQGVLPTVYRITKLKKRPGSDKGLLDRWWIKWVMNRKHRAEESCRVSFMLLSSCLFGGSEQDIRTAMLSLWPIRLGTRVVLSKVLQERKTSLYCIVCWNAGSSQLNCGLPAPGFITWWLHCQTRNKN